LRCCSGSKNIVLICESKVNILIVLALCNIGIALINEIVCELAGDPCFVVVGKWHDNVIESYLLSHCRIQPFHIQELLDLRVFMFARSTSEVINNFQLDVGFIGALPETDVPFGDGRIV